MLYLQPNFRFYTPPVPRLLRRPGQTSTARPCAARPRTQAATTMSHVRISRKDAERIDSSGRVIVGKTAADDDDDCVVDLELKPRSRTAAHAPGASSHYDTDSRAFSSATWLEPGGASSRFNLEDVAKKLEGVEHSTLERGLLTLKQTALGGHVNQFTLVFRDKQVRTSKRPSSSHSSSSHIL